MVEKSYGYTANFLLYINLLGGLLIYNNLISIFVAITDLNKIKIDG